MKDILIIVLIVLALIALFGDGGLTFSPTLAPAMEFSPALDLKADVNYAPVHIDTNIEQQTVIVEAPPAVVQPAVVQPAVVQPAPVVVQPVPTSGGLTLVDPVGPGCIGLQPDETIYDGPDVKGACFVVDGAGNKFFINAMGSRWPLK